MFDRLLAFSRAPFSRNLLAVCGLWFLYGFVGSPAHYIWNAALLNNRVFEGTLGSLIRSVLNVVPLYFVAAVLGSAIPFFVSSARPRYWAVAFAAYLSCVYYLGTQWAYPPAPIDHGIHILMALSIGASALLGFRFAVLAVRAPMPSPGA